MPDDDLTTETPAPQETDGPQEPVDDGELEQEQHPSVPESAFRFEWRAWPTSIDQVGYPEGVDPSDVLDDLIVKVN